MTLNLGDKDNLSLVLQSFQKFTIVEIIFKVPNSCLFSVEKYYDEIYCVDKNGLQIQLKFFISSTVLQNNNDATICRTHMQSPCGLLGCN